MEIDFLQSIQLEMWIVFVLGILTVITYSWKSGNRDNGVKKYFKLTIKNVLFHVISSTMVFLCLGELGEVIIKNWIPALKDAGGYYLVLSGLTGVLGSALVAWVIEIGKKLFS